MYFDRFDIIEAYYVWLAEHHAGQSSREYRRLSRITTYFRPRPSLNGRDSLTENGQEIYDGIETRHETREASR